MSRARRRFVFIAAAAGVLVVVAATAAGALDCTEITDCLGNSIRGSISALVGVGLLAGLIFAPEIFGPILIAKGIVEGITGQDVVTGEPLDWKQRALGALPLLGAVGAGFRIGDEVLQEGLTVARDEQALTEAEQAANQQWLDSLPRKATPLEGAPNQYEIRATGPDNFLISGGGEQVWADGFRVGDAQVLDAKYVGTPERSPFIPGSAMPPAIRATIVSKLENEMARYSAVIGDASNPAKGLEVITNDPRAVPFFQDLLTKYGIPGRVVVQP